MRPANSIRALLPTVITLKTGLSELVGIPRGEQKPEWTTRQPTATPFACASALLVDVDLRRSAFRALEFIGLRGNGHSRTCRRICWACCLLARIVFFHASPLWRILLFRRFRHGRRFMSRPNNLSEPIIHMYRATYTLGIVGFDAEDKVSPHAILCADIDGRFDCIQVIISNDAGLIRR